MFRRRSEGPRIGQEEEEVERIWIRSWLKGRKMSLVILSFSISIWVNQVPFRSRRFRGMRSRLRICSGIPLGSRLGREDRWLRFLMRLLIERSRLSSRKGSTFWRRLRLWIRSWRRWSKRGWICLRRKGLMLLRPLMILRKMRLCFLSWMFLFLRLMKIHWNWMTSWKIGKDCLRLAKGLSRQPLKKETSCPVPNSKGSKSKLISFMTIWLDVWRFSLKDKSWATLLWFGNQISEIIRLRIGLLFTRDLMRFTSTLLQTIKTFKKVTILTQMHFVKESKTKSAKLFLSWLWYPNRKLFRKSKKMTIISSKESNLISKVTTIESNKSKPSWRKDKKE